MTLFRFPAKKLRSKAVKRYMERRGMKHAVCFSCGNASRELREAGVDVLDVSPTGDMEALRWFEPSEIARLFPDAFDATSGHLPIECMLEVAEEFRAVDVPDGAFIPTGSGETLVCLKMAHPDRRLHAVYNLDDATKYEERAPLNRLVEALAESVVR